MRLGQCACLRQPLPADQYELLGSIGVDQTGGRYGRVTLKRCTRCGRWWLHYAVEYEAFGGSGRYYMGLISPRRARRLRADEAAAYLDRLPWHLYGGSYYDGRAGRSRGRVRVDL
ncbi:MAG: hypothetical protein JXA09_08155 [Anaerolineae bacterium]|nr:hypothetical protein [Anaerolineae bacterium]